MDNRFESNDGEQNIAQGDGVIGKQVNIYYTTKDGAPPPPPRQLPPLDACFLGRDKELSELVKQLHPGKVAAVCGPGGMGKSALAAQAVHTLNKLEKSRFPDGIVFHSFYHQSSTDMALQTICEAFQIEAKAGLATAVQAVLAGKKALLILDGAEEAEDLKAVLDLRNTCGVLITSRKRSDAQGTRFDLQLLADEAAVDVFCAYSKAAADDVTVRDICKILNGWPLALRISGRYLSSTKRYLRRTKRYQRISTGESAAAYLYWLKKKPLNELALNAEDAALLLRHSVAQVSEDARLVLGLAGCLAFATLAVAPITALLDGDERHRRIVVNQLVNYGLLERRDERLHIGHALIHQYAAKHLAPNKEELELMAGRYTWWCSRQYAAGPPGHALLDGERAHCLRLMEICLDRGLWQEVKGLVGATYIYFDRQGWWIEKLAALEMRLTAVRQAGDRWDKAWCLHTLGYTCWKCGNQDQALAWYEQYLSICRKLEDRQSEDATLNNMAEIYRQQETYEHALQDYEQDLAICREGEDRKGEGTTLNNMAALAYNQGEYEQALLYFEQCLPLRQEAGDKVGDILNNIAAIYRAQGEPSEKVFHQQNLADLAICREQGDRVGEAYACRNIGRTYKAWSDGVKEVEMLHNEVRYMYEQALQYFKQCLPIWQEVRDKSGVCDTMDNIAAIYDKQNKPAKAVEYYKQALTIAQEIGDRAGEAIRYWNVGTAYEAMGNLAKAEEHINLAVQIAEDIDHPSLEKYREVLEWVRAVRRGGRHSPRRKGVPTLWERVQAERQA